MLLNDLVSDPETGTLCSIEFIFRPRNWKEIEYLLGPVPKILIGWEASGEHGYTGNSLLEITDPVAEIGNICESREQQRRCNEGLFKRQLPRPIEGGASCAIFDEWNNGKEYEGRIIFPPIDFGFAVAFSKNGFKKFLKEMGE